MTRSSANEPVSFHQSASYSFLAPDCFPSAQQGTLFCCLRNALAPTSMEPVQFLTS